MLRAILVFGLAAGVATAQPTYSKEISRIFQSKCETCHREGDIGPFVISDYVRASAWGADIRRVVESRKMPPWKPVAGHGEFTGVRSLGDEDRQAILDWVDAAMPEGDPADMPEPLQYSSDWPLGAPDMELKMIQGYTPPRGADVYRCFVIPTNTDETKYLGAVDFIPGDRRIVHHILLFQDTSGTAEKLEGLDGQPGYTCFGGPGFEINLNNLTAALGGWAPGQRPAYLPEGVGLELKKGAKLVMQVHYYPVGRTGEDQTRIGFYFAKGKVTNRLFQIPVVNTGFKIPPGDDNKEVTATMTVLPFLDGKAIWMYPHMHLLGRQIKVQLIKPDKTVVPMIYEDDWDFNWQGSYTYKEPMAFHAGDTIKLTCNFNNSDSNPRNPNNPLVTVGWGERTTDEMCLAFVGVTLDFEKLLPLTASRQ